MPWCPQCDSYRAPSALEADGRCSQCGADVDPGGLRKVVVDDDGLPPVPWHLKLLIVAFLVYLAFRSWAGVEWIIDKF